MAHNFNHRLSMYNMGDDPNDTVTDDLGNIVPKWMMQPAIADTMSDTTSYNAPLMPQGGLMSAENTYDARNSATQVSGATNNNMKVGMNAGQQAQQNLANVRDIVPGSVKMVSQTPRVSNPQMQYQSPLIENVQTVYDSRTVDPSVEAVNQRIEVWNRRNTDQLSLRDTSPEMSGMNPTEQLANPNVGFLDQDAMEGVLSADPSQINDMAVSSFDSRDFAEPVAASMGQKLKGGFGKAKDFIADNAMAGLTYGLPIAQGITKMASLKGGIDQARGLRDSLRDTISGLAGESAAYEQESNARFSESRRQFGDRANERLQGVVDQIRNIRTGNLVSGTQREKISDSIDSNQSALNIQIANEFDRKLDRDSSFAESQNAKRQQMNSQLDQINDQIASMKKEQAMAPVNMLADIGLAAMGPAGLPLRIGKELLLG